MNLHQKLESQGWDFVAHIPLPDRPGRFTDPRNLPLRPTTLSWLTKHYSSIYSHQAEAIRHVAKQQNVLLATGTASGKTLVFHVAALEHLQTEPDSRILAVYPLKALAAEQELRWKQVLNHLGIQATVARIDGSVPVATRTKLIATHRIILATPDVIHAWLLSHLADKAIVRFLRHLRLIILDELHTYTGVFGSNCAFLFRRLRHALRELRSPNRFLLASATINDPETTVKHLLGIPCHIIAPEDDGSPRHPTDIYLLKPPGERDALTETSNFLRSLTAEQRDEAFIAFVNSRKQTEQLAAIALRFQEDEADCSDQQMEVQVHDDAFSELYSPKILPYRAGYEDRDRSAIQHALTSGTISGVISTSALELGLDISGLTTAVLFGVPPTATSLWQRIGRVGRNKPGRVYIIYSGSPLDDHVFAEPQRLLERPLESPALYLNNQRIQYIHALCVARPGGEHDQLHQSQSTEEFTTHIEWPDGFIDLCNAERSGNVPKELLPLKHEAGDDPHHAYPLRDVESQYQVEYRMGSELRSLGRLSFSQVMREAYPGAIYYYITSPYRVYQVLPQQRLIRVRKERHYFTQPMALPFGLFPRLDQESILRIGRLGRIYLLETELLARESVVGFRERRGLNTFTVNYPLDEERGYRYSLTNFSRYFSTSGCLLFHPEFLSYKDSLHTVSKILFEAFMICLPFDRQDIGFGSGDIKADFGEIRSGDRFLAIFDRTYGSLRLSGSLFDGENLLNTVSFALEISKQRHYSGGTIEGELVGEDHVKLLSVLQNEVRSHSIEWLSKSKESSKNSDAVRVIVPGSKGINVVNGQEFLVESVFFHPGTGELRYRGKNESSKDHVDILSIGLVSEIPGVSTIGFYDLDLGTIVEASDYFQS
ncbi:DEAD/DEAH box helicase [Tepidiforma thermophila]|uniref:DEAD/DEAH box helicase domain-containing protein n=1 Tax=Tepidiforma thermophila (strain KCTC 52669 / CGMCC 1.13589 / G233) TaxID=2761530 RepID=A0A2A9HBE0_TEPT2|nr:DEAD/DEAH box helicase [Tepidiforma thermophila]PFG73297.1 DEAD/DEAH box helicase domain-containing protein [Tepidiforma thermophila]